MGHHPPAPSNPATHLLSVLPRRLFLDRRRCSAVADFIFGLPGNAVLDRAVDETAEIPDGHRWDAPPKVEFATDSPLEGDGFEPSVPAKIF